MKTSTRLDSAVFQLTPTRTRCDLVIYANGKAEKIASGLVSPFLAHLKTAQDQMAKGGYSLIIEPEPSTDATWFTKETVERFVRFVSTPEVLERVHTLESEILQIEEAITMQSNNDIGLHTVEEAPGKPVESIEGSRPVPDCNEEKAIVLYNPGAESPEVNTSTAPEGNSKVQLLKVLETRRTALQKEQGMAFARAVAAGFDVDRMAPLMSFAESFGATRLMKACVRFMELWRRKHETGQWLELEEAEAMYNQPDFSAMNASGIMLSNVINRPKEFSETFESNGKTGEKPTTDHQPGVHPEYFQGQFPHPMYPPWPTHSPPGAPPVFQGYPMQGMQYYQSPYYQPPYPSSEDPRSYSAPRMGRRHSMDSRDSNNGLETQDDEGFEKETSRKKGSHSGKKKSGKVVIRNLNYITSKREDSSDGVSESPSNSKSDDEDGELRKSRSSRKKESQIRTMDESNSYDVAMITRKEEDGRQWQAFQSYLLRDADEEEEIRGRRRQSTVGDDPLISRGQDMGEYHQGNVTDFHMVSGSMGRMRKGLNDELLTSGRGNQYDDGRSSLELQSEINGRSGYRRTGNDDFMINRQENMNSPSDPLVLNRFEQSNNGNRRSLSQNMDDDSYIVARSSVAANDGRNGIDLESELPPTNQTAGEASSRVVNYEPDELILIPDRGKEKGLGGYDPAFDYEVQANVEGVSSLNKKNKEAAEADVKKGSQKAERNRKLKMDSSDRKTGGPIRKGRPSKLSPLDEARARAEKLRSYKADLQKMKKEKEEEETRRLEALKIARQKRIAAKSGFDPAQTSLLSLHTRRSLPTKLSPSTHKASKFSDAEPGPSSPLQRFSIKTPPVKSANSSKVSKTSKLNTGSNSTGNRLTRSGSSLTEPKREKNGTVPDTKVASMARIRRLSEPKMSSSGQHVSSSKSKPKVSDGSEVKKLSAIVNHDKSKAASLPELKVRKSKEPNVIQNKAFEKEPLLKVKGTKSSTTGDLKGNKLDKTLDHRDIDDNLVIEKTVVQEYETASVPAANTREEHFDVQKEHCVNSKIEEENEVSDYAVIRAPVSSLFVDRVDKIPIGDQFPEHHSSYEVTTVNSPKPEKESPKYSSIKVGEEPYQAPHARVSSLEDVCTDNTENGRTQPTGMQVKKTETSVTKPHMVSKDLKPEKVPETLAKMQIKESPKGFRRLLKFGKKSHSSSTDDHNVEAGNVSVSGSEGDDVTTNAASSSEVHTLKNLIFQDETPAAGATPQKSSRSFSLLSPFRSKNSEKKLTT